MSINELLAEKYPGLEAVQINNGALLISGVVKYEQKWQRLKLHLPHYPQLRDLVLYVQQHLEYKSYNSASLQLQAEWQLEDLLCHLPQLLPAQPELVAAVETKQSSIYAEIVALYKPDAYRMQSNDARTCLRFSQFTDHVQHYLQLELPTLRLLEHSLPDCVPWQELFSKSAQTLTDTLTLFMKFLEELRPFYESFMDIDELCHVVQPQPITTKHNIRVFPISERVYIKLTIANPFASQSSLALQIIGPTEEVARLRHVLSDGLSDWDPELDVHKNLLRIFDLCYFPMPSVDISCSQEEEQQQHCNICFVYRLDDGAVPIVSCDNTRCVLKCHAACLKEWFKTLSGDKTFLEVSFGLCPFCKAKLSTSFVALLED